jgi:hypothetical protein
VIAVLAFLLVYRLIAVQYRRVWHWTPRPWLRLLYVLAVHVAGVLLGFGALMLTALAMIKAGLSESGPGLYDGLTLAAIIAVAFSLVMAFVHWWKHRHDLDAAGLSHLLKTELQRRERVELAARAVESARQRAEQERENARQRAEQVRSERLSLADRPAPSGVPSSWSTEVLRAEIARQDRLASLEREYARLMADAQGLARNQSPSPAGSALPAAGRADPDRCHEEADVMRRLANIEEWNRRQREP